MNDSYFSKDYPIMNRETIDELRIIMQDGFIDLVLTLLQEMPVQLAAIYQAIEQDDAESLYRNAHKLKSGCGSIGALRLSYIAKQLEFLGRHKNLVDTPPLLKQLRSTAEQTHIAFQTLLDD